MALLLPAGDAAADNAAAMGQAGMVLLHLLGGDEFHGGVVVGEVVGHGLDGRFNGGLVGALLGHHIAVTGMLFPGGQFGIFALADPLQGLRYGNGVLTGVGHAGNPADGVGMALAYALAPEGIVLALGQNGRGIETVDREQARVPAQGDHSHMAAGLGGSVHGGEVGRDVGMGVKAVDDMKLLGQGRGHGGQVRGGAAAENQNVHLVLPAEDVVQRCHGDAGGADGQGSRVAAGKYHSQIHVCVLGDGAFHAPGQIAIANNADSSHM